MCEVCEGAEEIGLAVVGVASASAFSLPASSAVYSCLPPWASYSPMLRSVIHFLFLIYIITVSLFSMRDVCTLQAS